MIVHYIHANIFATVLSNYNSQAFNSKMQKYYSSKNTSILYKPMNYNENGSIYTRNSVFDCHLSPLCFQRFFIYVRR